MYFYSAKENQFYPYELKQNYINAGSWPDDGIDVDDSVYSEFVGNMPPEGKIRIADDNGLPAWGDIPPPTHEELQQQAERKRQFLLNDTDIQIMRLERIVRRNMATNDEINRLDSWELYSIALSRLDCSKVPDINWPKKPE
ncbi:tail fiber assembly protein [Xenorhabdus griffiniae]|uniref:Tail fiber assembly protein n=1 Tax=Xenorhabdus griffiniae TaxID=351672 RepID=A0ABY9XKD7_9GAMM|nr:tail fiber assembly protein [Xenorhabdus griffiniae]MBD1229495.1 tail fiber assembly protein [Xenorhabdus griffiniae]MBE8587986.1 tail fiber assembly protein [Xenorhabdus griffiniae]WMV73402.1 tail fiber assembly protein [Xenorhabdus griffiniae]WNH03081.1 tail fiber assembly protein [Xenorhabdus griffiniae]